MNENPLNINLVEQTREEYEDGQIDYHRFQYPNNYLTQDSLKYFKDSLLRQLFVKIYLEKPTNVVEVVNTFVKENGDTPRLRQVRDIIFSNLTTDGATPSPLNEQTRVWELKVFVEKDSDKYKALQEFLLANNYEFSALPVLPKDYLNKRFTPPFRIGKKQRRVVLDSNGLEVFVAPKGREHLAKLYCDALNKEMVE